uniref:GTPase-activating protein CdGAPr n=2 Tax=Cacopsylla melanoneura TaxID=428564 RepID=A0A8D9EG70_9HEMI
MFLEQPEPLLHAGGMSTRRSRGLSDILPQFTTMHNKNSISELETRSGGSVRIQHFVPPPPPEEGKSRFPKLEECAHFHYEHVELGSLQIQLYDDEDLKSASLSTSITESSGGASNDLTTSLTETKWWVVKVTSCGQSWLLRRSYENFRMLDSQLHRCIYDRKFSALPELPSPVPDSDDPEVYMKRMLSKYLERLSSIAGSLINCGPVLSWMELDNRGRRLLVTEGDSCPINTPAVAAAYSVVKYNAVAADEISFEVGDMISVIDMPPPEESIWWRGKRGFLVGFFPAHCVMIITDRVPRNLTLHQALSIPPYGEPSKPVLKKHGKLIAFFRAFILSRPSRRRLKQSGILRERVFGCDLGEHLLNSGVEVPMVLKCCSEFIETHGIVDGIYRLSGVTSNIQRLRHTFDEDRIPDLYTDDTIVQDIHSVASLLKMYFRELPNPLCTYQLYHSFVSAVQQEKLQDQLALMRETVEKLPPPHYRTLEYLIGHLSRVAAHGAKTGMTARNVAIVWAPNLLRCKELEFGGVAALQGVGVQAVVTEFLVVYYAAIFDKKNPRVSSSGLESCRPKSLVISTPTKLLSLEEAQNRALNPSTEQDYIEVGGGPANLPVKYHTVIDLPSGRNSRRRKRSSSSSGGTCSKRSPLGWRSIFSRSSNKGGGGGTDRKTSMPNTFEQAMSKSSDDHRLLHGSCSKDHHLASAPLRPVKSAESLTPSNSNPASSRNSACLDTLPGHSRSVSHDSYFDQITSPSKEKKGTGEGGIGEEEEDRLKEEDRGE